MDDKLFYKIGEVSRLTGLEPYVLRYWESEFSVLRPRKNRGGQRIYLKKDIELILKIKNMLYEEGYTIQGAKKKLQGRTHRRTDRNPAMILHKVKSELREILKGIKQP